MQKSLICIGIVLFSFFIIAGCIGDEQPEVEQYPYEFEDNSQYEQTTQIEQNENEQPENIEQTELTNQTIEEINGTDINGTNESVENNESLSDLEDISINEQNTTSENNQTIIFKEKINITFLDVGHADATLVQIPDKNILIDAGSQKIDLIEKLQMMNLTKIDLLIISSWDEQKVEKVSQVIREFEVDEVWTSEKIPQKISYEQISGSLRQLAVVTNNPKAGQQYKFEELIIDVYNPQEIEYDDNSEANSIVLRLSYGDFCAFLPSDLDATEPQVLSIYDDKKCSVFKMRNNGEARPQASVLFDKISPLDVIISVGQNEYGYPSSTTLQRLSIAKVGIYRTDLDGDIRVNAGYDGDYLIYTDN